MDLWMVEMSVWMKVLLWAEMWVLQRAGQSEYQLDETLAEHLVGKWVESMAID